MAHLHKRKTIKKNLEKVAGAIKRRFNEDAKTIREKNKIIEKLNEKIAERNQKITTLENS